LAVTAALVQVHSSSAAPLEDKNVLKSPNWDNGEPTAGEGTSAPSHGLAARRPALPGGERTAASRSREDIV
jgi:hypothetical protein